jgi:hypothetical protein
MSSEWKSERTEELVAQRLLIVVVLWCHNRENGSSAGRFEEIANACRFA